MNIQLNYINQSNDTNNSDIVIFQKNVATDFDELAIAWLVIQNCAMGDNHPFSFPMSLEVGASDSYGNYTPRLPAQNGELFALQPTATGHHIVHTGNASSPHEIQLVNSLPQGAINADIFRANRLLAAKTSIAPQQMAVFQFKPAIWIGVASEIVEGQVMNSAILSSINTEISLLGIASADIVMTGGGPGKEATPFVFSLENIVMV